MRNPFASGPTCPACHQGRYQTPQQKSACHHPYHNAPAEYVDPSAAVVPIAPPPPRSEAEVLEELFEVTNRARRMPYNARNYGPTHALINELLDELEAARHG